MNTYTKYPRSHHLPWSLGATSDDKTIPSTDIFEGKLVVVTEKMDGENTTLYNDHIHARSIDSRYHPSRAWVKQFHANIAYMIPDGWRICGENLYAKHSIAYEGLESFFYGFSIWDEKNECLSWLDTLEWFDKLSIVPVPTLYSGTYDEDLIKSLPYDTIEGYVVRLDSSFHYDVFTESLAKYVRKDHVQTDKHWMHGTWEKNYLEGEIPFDKLTCDICAMVNETQPCEACSKNRIK